MTACEDADAWHADVSQRVAEDPELADRQVELLLRSFDFARCEDFEESDYLNSLAERYDIIVVDGQEQDMPVRPICFQRAERFVKPGGIVVLDDAYRYPGVRASHNAKSMRTFRGTGPCRYGVTETDVYFY